MVPTPGKVTYEALEAALLEVGAVQETATRIVQALQSESVPAGLAGDLTDGDLNDMGLGMRGDRMVLRAAARRIN